MTAATIATATLADVVAELYRPGEHVSLCTAERGGAFQAVVFDVAALPAPLPQDRNVWFGANPVTPGTTGRGTVADVTRWAALYADLDVKPGSLPNMDAARSVVDVLGAMANTPPVALIASGHGLQPVWALDPDDPAADLTQPGNREAAQALMRRWGRLVARVAADHGARDVDTVFDLARILRAPGTLNHKGAPVPATATLGGGYALTVADVADMLDAYGVPELPEDRRALGAVVAPPADWHYGQRTCPYVAAMVAGWATQPVTARHPWLLSQAVRLAAAHRAGCITEHDHGAAWRALVARFRWLLAHQAPTRPEAPRETEDAAAWGVRRAAALDAAELGTELGTHAHREPLDVYTVGPPPPHTQTEGLADGNKPTGDEDGADRLPFTDGGTFLFDVPEVPPAIWGNGAEVLWAEGEGLILAGPSGVGKTTLAGQILRARIGLQADVLGYAVVPTASRVLYLAMDRPQQARRALARTFRGDDRAQVADRLRFWKGPPPTDLAKHPDMLANMARQAGADTVIVDSLKDAAIGLSEDDVGASYNRARQTAITAGVQVLELHHTVKRGPNGARPTKLEDLYGSVWITAGAGSVIMLWGAAGDPIVDLFHLKQPAEPVGPLRIIHDHGAGVSTVWHSTDPLTVVRLAGAAGITAQRLAAAMFETDKPDRNDVEKSRRKLDKLARDGLVEASEGTAPAGGGKPHTVYRAITRAITHDFWAEAITPPTSNHVPDITAGQTITEPITAITHASNHVSPPLYTGGGTGAPEGNTPEPAPTGPPCTVCAEPVGASRAACGLTRCAAHYNVETSKEKP